MEGTVFVVDNPVRARAVCQHIATSWPLAARMGRPLVVTVEVEHRQRTIAQNKRLHALIQHIADHAVVDGRRFSADAIKEYVRRRWIGTEEVELPDGTRIDRGISTTTLSVEQCARLMESVEAWAVTDLGIDLQHT